MTEVLKTHRSETIKSYKKLLETRVLSYKNTKNMNVLYEKTIQKAVIQSILFSKDFSNIFTCIENTPGRKKRKVSCEELFDVLVKHAGFGFLSFSEFVGLLKDIEEKHFYKQNTNQKEAELMYLIRSIEESFDSQNDSDDLDGFKNKIFTVIAEQLQEHKASATNLLSKIDSDQDNQLSCDEFIEFMKKIDIFLRKTEALCIFKYLNCSSMLKVPDFKKKLEEVGYSDPFYTNSFEYS